MDNGRSAIFANPDARICGLWSETTYPWPTSFLLYDLADADQYTPYNFDTLSRTLAREHRV